MKPEAPRPSKQATAPTPPEETPEARPTWHAVDVVGVMAAVLPAIVRVPSRREKTVVSTIEGRTFESTTVEETDSVALIGGGIALACAIAGVLLFRTFAPKRRPLRIGIALMLVILGGLHVARGAGAFSGRDEGPLTQIGGPPLPASVEAPPLADHEALGVWVRSLFPTFPISAVRCPPFQPTTAEVTCALDIPGSASIDLVLGRTETDWKILSPKRIYTARNLAAELTLDLSSKMKTEVVVDCGTGLILVTGNYRHVCAASRKSSPEPRQVDVAFGKIEVTFKPDQGYTWAATAL
ncbi:hypothetical protein [Chondromyces crocatus]|uniref:Uncharacterized protein n=1 Tax=Chondromyces crocatus TaxID=52 RepID=A0A0K1EC67_CHOCO|nr:hypothetical protein [Chondromyces crocatus]AKT38465.1 uncharacterized protein CMC5_026120 [Chondromyces crocatus]